RPNRGVRFGASTTVARALLAAREHDPAIRFAVDCRLTDAVEDALASLDGRVAAYDPGERPDGVSDDATAQWGVDRAFGTSDGTPVAVVGREGVGTDGRVMLLAADVDDLVSRVETIGDGA
ncbi:thiamine-phosphate synthase family protein, partial [Haloarcula sp. CBA1122]|uniref:thiamine-phosphate synthase family protein n=1 Tax=Haloarcula sp. CBA1122 TaxID=2668069 RepID=UPI001306A49D